MSFKQSKQNIRRLFMIPLFIAQDISRSILNLISAVNHRNLSRRKSLILQLKKQFCIDVPSPHILLELWTSQTQGEVGVETLICNVARNHFTRLFNIFKIYIFDIILSQNFKSSLVLCITVFENTSLWWDLIKTKILGSGGYIAQKLLIELWLKFSISNFI